MFNLERGLENFQNSSSLQIPEARGPTISPYKRREYSTYHQIIENLIQGTYAVKPAEPVTEYKYLNGISEFLDRKILAAAEKFTVSRKVFVSSLPKNWKRDVIENSFRCFGALTIQWLDPNGKPYDHLENDSAFLVFNEEESVKNMMNMGTLNELGYSIDIFNSLKEKRTRLGQQNSFQCQSSLAHLAEAVDKIFPGVAFVKILTDEIYDYPTGYARIFFTNENSYQKCISEQYVSLEFNNEERRVKFIPFDEQLCHTGNFSQDNSDVTLEASTSQTAIIRLEWDRPPDEYFKNKMNSQS
ncbi:Cytoplasmic polyadenylation element-binding protein 3 [Trichinella pseudospiralis]|uniref:Cytoplasmic polyadenylation element-binding protein 3 n=2 Tax=Trichinella pseudospiralis TaxID=6337 RepID=A0A0V1IBL5_TRIPS|nr:Cytoplasmic polyadenylation element-binding protein 3 [Trichinella pseudospiralis]KRZ20236.1 Cytoplasmic polyadenylation element-binding protein 3 [Trichinella pseudospiralis]